ncbi:MAG: hypothetical protein GSR73_07080, partial [Desulfurococcales archaeon]|nr:hypothetical protein [Desulfurococcales archaeon]
FLDGEPYYVLFIGRGSIEAVDRAWVISHDPGVKEVLFVGSAASLESRVKASSCNVPRYAIGVGDPSLAYVGLVEGLPVADEEVAGRVSGIAGEAGCRVYSLLHASVPYFYMETRRFLSYLSGVGVSTIDMELAYVLRVFDSMGKRAAGLVVVEDSPLHGVEYMSVGYERVRDLVDMVRRSVLPRVVVEFLRAG